jgi:uncharacterized ion transporter superfamily protein YfcC
MAYKNGSYYCDSCGVKQGPSAGWKVANSAATCPKCQQEMKVLKMQEKELERNKDEFKKRNKTREYTSNSSSLSDLSGWEKFLVIMKWIFSFVWGGPYLAIQGYKNKNKFWLITGIEFTLVFIFAAIVVNLIPGLTESTEPLHVFLTYLIGGLLVINIIALIVYWVKYREE